MSYSNKNITVFCGHICSGKSTEAKKYASLFKEKESLFIEVSDIVKEILNEEDRDKLQGHPELDTKILITILNKINNSSQQQIIISGPRQLSIIKGLSEAFGLGLTIVWVNVDINLAYYRFNHRKDKKDENISYTDAFKKDQELGMKELADYCQKLLTFKNINLPVPFNIVSMDSNGWGSN